VLFCICCIVFYCLHVCLHLYHHHFYRIVYESFCAACHIFVLLQSCPVDTGQVEILKSLMYLVGLFFTIPHENQDEKCLKTSVPCLVCPWCCFFTELCMSL